jgi:hypothetical protein
MIDFLVQNSIFEILIKKKDFGIRKNQNNQSTWKKSWTTLSVTKKFKSGGKISKLSLEIRAAQLILTLISVAW